MDLDRFIDRFRLETIESLPEPALIQGSTGVLVTIDWRLVRRSDGSTLLLLDRPHHPLRVVEGPDEDFMAMARGNPMAAWDNPGTEWI